MARGGGVGTYSQTAPPTAGRRRKRHWEEPVAQEEGTGGLRVPGGTAPPPWSGTPLRGRCRRRRGRMQRKMPLVSWCRAGTRTGSIAGVEVCCTGGSADGGQHPCKIMHRAVWRRSSSVAQEAAQGARAGAASPPPPGGACGSDAKRYSRKRPVNRSSQLYPFERSRAAAAMRWRALSLRTRRLSGGM